MKQQQEIILFLFSCFPLVRSAPLRKYSHFMEKISSNRSFFMRSRAVRWYANGFVVGSLSGGKKEEKPKWNCTIWMLNSDDDDDDVVVYSREATYISRWSWEDRSLRLCCLARPFTYARHRLTRGLTSLVCVPCSRKKRFQFSALFFTTSNISFLLISPPPHAPCLCFFFTFFCNLCAFQYI